MGVIKIEGNPLRPITYYCSHCNKEINGFQHHINVDDALYHLYCYAQQESEAALMRYLYFNSKQEGMPE